MRSRTDVTVLLALLLAGYGVGDGPLREQQAAPATQDLPPEVAQSTGPRGTSAEAREDVVGYASIMTAAPETNFVKVTVGVAHPTLPAGSFVELTALETGRTIIAMVVAQETDGSAVALSPAAAQALDVADHAPVRVRSINASPQDQVALRSGQAASRRLDAPPGFLVALRRKLPAQHTPAPVASTRKASARAAPSTKPRPVATPAPAKTVDAGFIVQVAALSSADRAATLARQLGGRVAPLGKLYRVQLGPFADMPSAKRARDGVAQRGYADARISHTE